MKSMVRRRETHLLLSPRDLRPRYEGFEVIGTFNPGAVDLGDRIALMIRVVERPAETRAGWIALPRIDDQRSSPEVDWHREEEVEILDPRLVRIRTSGEIRLTYVSWLQVAFSPDGRTIDELGEPFLPSSPLEAFGVEDARLTQIEGRTWITSVAVSEHGAATALASTEDFRSFERHGVIFPAENKDVVILPERVAGDFIALHRPNPRMHFAAPGIWTARSPDLLNWGRHQPLAGARPDWATAKSGAGTPPIRTCRGWLSLIHGNADDGSAVGTYAAAALLQDLEDPERVRGLSPRPVMVPEVEFERHGFVDQVVFPTGVVQREDELLVFYGAADTSCGVAVFGLEELLDSVNS